MPLPFTPEIRVLANQCLDRYAAMHHGRALDSDVSNADLEALMLIKTGFDAAIRDAQRAGHELLALHLTGLLGEVRRDGAYVWLNGLAIDGGGREAT